MDRSIKSAPFLATAMAEYKATAICTAFCYNLFRLLQELRELTKLDDVRCLVRKNELERGRTPASLDEIKAKRPKNRIDALLTKVQYVTLIELIW